MTSSSYPYEEEWEEDEWQAAVYRDSAAYGGKLPVELAVIAAAILIAFVLGWGALGLINQTGAPTVAHPADSSEGQSENVRELPRVPPLPDQGAIIAPYDEFIVTQGIHGLSYGHMAIDIAAGKGAPIKSPINGTVSELFFDAIGNPTLVIENEQYEVTLLHGIYTVSLGDKISIADEIGAESNLGNTRDMQGNSCRGRDCGYHTHLNIYDKVARSNINPLVVIGN